MAWEQTPHNLAVNEIVKVFEQAGCDVKAAHIDTHPTPKSINGRIPDIVAYKDGKIWIVEVDTMDSPDEQNQADDLQAATKTDPGVSFHRYIVGAKGWDLKWGHPSVLYDD